MVKRTRRYRKRGGGEIPPLQKYGFENAHLVLKKCYVKTKTDCRRTKCIK